jgi:archaellum biogenesis ATPase FlaH
MFTLFSPPTPSSRLLPNLPQTNARTYSIASRLSQKKLLCIGLNYGGKLSGCTSDAMELKKSMQLHYHITESKCIIDSVTKSITKRNLLDALEWLTSGSESGDVLFLTYCGMSKTASLSNNSIE